MEDNHFDIIDFAIYAVYAIFYIAMFCDDDNLQLVYRSWADIFMVEGRLIALMGAVLGIVIGVVLCYIQQKYGVIRFGHSAGSYIIDAYPVNIHIMDIIIIFITVVLLL